MWFLAGLAAGRQSLVQNLALSSDPGQLCAPAAESIRTDVASVAFVKGGLGSPIFWPSETDSAQRKLSDASELPNTRDSFQKT